MLWVAAVLGAVWVCGGWVVVRERCGWGRSGWGQWGWWGRVGEGGEGGGAGGAGGRVWVVLRVAGRERLGGVGV